MDDQQHALSALLRTIAIAEDRQVAGAARSDDGPSAGLWVLALLAAFNPARVAFGVPSLSDRSAGGRRRERATIAGLGALAGAAVVLLFGAVSGPLLDVLDVSAPSFRIGAGVVGAVAGVAAVFRRRSPADPALPGRWAALVPVAVPLVANVALVVLAISVAADRGLPVLTWALVAGGVLSVAAAVIPPEGAPGRLVGVAARATGALLVLAGVLLVVDGALAV